MDTRTKKSLCEMRQDAAQSQERLRTVGVQRTCRWVTSVNDFQRSVWAVVLIDNLNRPVCRRGDAIHK